MREFLFLRLVQYGLDIVSERRCLHQDCVDGAVLSGSARDARVAGFCFDNRALCDDVTSSEMSVRRAFDDCFDCAFAVFLGFRIQYVRDVRDHHAGFLVVSACAHGLGFLLADFRECGGAAEFCALLAFERDVSAARDFLLLSSFVCDCHASMRSQSI